MSTRPVIGVPACRKPIDIHPFHVVGEKYLQAIIDNSADIIITVDPDGFIRTFNPGAEKILGYSSDEIIGQRIEKIFAEPKDRDAANSARHAMDSLFGDSSDESKPDTLDDFKKLFGE